VATYPANSELVTQAWLSSLPFLNDGMVNPRLPEATETSTDAYTSGFVTHQVVGGSPNIYVPERQPVLAVKAYGFPKKGSRKPQYDLSSGLLERIVKATYDTGSFNAILDLGTGYPTAQVQQGHPVSEVRPSYGDKAYWAVYMVEIQIIWRELPS
jgi:hypothetical protein